MNPIRYFINWRRARADWLAFRTAKFYKIYRRCYDEDSAWYYGYVTAISTPGA